MTPKDELPTLSVETGVETAEEETTVLVEVAVDPDEAAAAAAAAASAGSFETVLVIMIGAYPGAVTVPPLTTDTGAAGVAAAVPVEDDYVTATSRIGAPRSRALVANA